MVELIILYIFILLFILSFQVKSGEHGGREGTVSVQMVKRCDRSVLSWGWPVPVWGREPGGADFQLRHSGHGQCAEREGKR
jgi:hypothetical protein